MARRKRESHGANHERWLVSYADFITLLFAFFVMLYANSTTNVAQAKKISLAFREAVEDGRLGRSLVKLVREDAGGGPGHTRGPKIDPKDLQPSLDDLNQSLEKEITQNEVEVRMEKRGLVITLREATFFPSGGEILDATTYPVLEKIAQELRKHPNAIRFEGHTDSMPIHTARFASNWDLSSARAIAMLKLFTERFGIETGRLAVSGFGDTSPVASNDTQDGRNRNRRVDIVVLNEEASSQGPKQK